MQYPRWVRYKFFPQDSIPLEYLGYFYDDYELYNPKKQGFVHQDELRDIKNDGRLWWLKENEINLEIVIPKLNKVYSIDLTRDQETGIYHPAIDDSKDTIYEKRVLIPLIVEGLGEEHNRFLTEKEQREFGTYDYYNEKKIVDDINSSFLDNYQEERLERIKELNIPDEEKAEMSRITPIPLGYLSAWHQKALKEAGPDIANVYNLEPRSVGYICLLDNSRTYVELLKNTAYDLFDRLNLRLNKNQIPWRKIAKESITDTTFLKHFRGPHYLEYGIADVVENNSTSDRFDAILRVKWEKKY